MAEPSPRRRCRRSAVVSTLALAVAAGLVGLPALAGGVGEAREPAAKRSTSAGKTGGSLTDAGAASANAVSPLPSLAEPAISPDGSEIAFVSGGDIWTVPSTGGTAHLLVSHPSTESRPIYSPDGKRLAFVSTRTGNGDVYVLTFATGDVARLTYDDGSEQLDAWSGDGQWLYFSSSVSDMGAGNADVYRVRADGGTPMPVSAERYTNEVQAAPSPDGRALAMAAGGNTRDWWRNGHSNWNETHVWVRRERKDGKPTYEELTRPGAREMWPMWSGDGKTVYCVSDRHGKPQNLVAYDLRVKPDVVAGAGKDTAIKDPADAKGKREGENRSKPESGTKPECGSKSSDGTEVKAIATAAADEKPGAKAEAKARPATKPAAVPVAYREPKPVTTFTDGRVLWPSISYDGKTIVFERDFSLWTLDVSGGPGAASAPRRLDVTLRGSAATAEAVSPLNFVGGFRGLSLSPDGRKLAFVAHGEVFAASARDGGRAVRVTHTAASEGHLAWAPDSRRLVFASASADAQNLVLYDFGTQQQTTLTTGKAYDATPRFSPDGKSIVFRRNGTELRLMDLATKSQRVLAKGLAAVLPPFDEAASPYVFSPRGQWLAYIDSGKRSFDNVFVVPTTGTEGAASPGSVAKGKPAADGAGKLKDEGAKGAVAKLPEPTQVTFFANTGSNAVSWTPDGKSLLFGTGMRTEDYQLARVDLVARPTNFSEDQFRGLFDEEPRTTRPGGPRQFRQQNERPQTERPASPGGPPAPPAVPATQPASDPASLDPATRPATQPATLPAAIRNLLPAPMAAGLEAERFAFDQVRQRTSLLNVGVDVDQQVVTPDGKWAVLIGTAGGKANVYAYPLDPAAGGGEGSALRQLTSTAGGKSSLCAAPDSKEVYYLDGGQVRAVNLDTRAVRELAVSASMEVDFAQEKREVFRQAWTYLKLNFYDPQMHGADWDAIRKRVEPRVAGAKTADELRRVLALMIGELNASHLGISGGRSASGSGGGVGRLGVRYDRQAYEADGTLKIAEVLTNGPAAQAGLKVGDKILSVDGEPVDAEANLDQLMERKVGRRVALKVQSAPNSPKAEGATKPAGSDTGPDDGKPDVKPKAEEREVAVRPVDAATERTLLYRDWVEANRARVAKDSHGRLGYVHIADMGGAALTRLNTDLDAEAANREGVVVDVRANTGGFASPYVLDVLGRKGYLTIGRRGAVESPGRMYVGQRALDLPTVLVTNRQSISDAENFTEGYRALKLGKVVGEPTAGGVIFTSDVTLIDGTVFRIPFSKVTSSKGESLEGDGRPVDTLVRRKLGETAADKDSQLDAAVKSLLRQLDRPKAGK